MCIRDRSLIVTFRQAESPSTKKGHQRSLNDSSARKKTGGGEGGRRRGREEEEKKKEVEEESVYSWVLTSHQLRRIATRWEKEEEVEERERENSNSNSKTLFHKDCSLG